MVPAGYAEDLLGLSLPTAAPGGAGGFPEPGGEDWEVEVEGDSGVVELCVDWERWSRGEDGRGEGIWNESVWNEADELNSNVGSGSGTGAGN